MITVRELLTPKDPGAPVSLRGAFTGRLAGLLSVRDAHAVLTKQIQGKPQTVESTSLFPVYLTVGLRKLMKRMSDALEVGEVPENFEGNASAIVSNTGRKILRVFLNRNNLHADYQSTADSAYQALAEHRFGDVDKALKDLAGLDAATTINETILDRALLTHAIPFERAKPGGGTQTVSLPGYKGPQPDANEKRALLVLLGLCGHGPELDFRTTLLEAESALKKRRYQAALDGYQRLRDRLTERDDAGRRLLFAREAVAHAGLADRLYREAPDATTASLQPALAQFGLAEVFLIASGVTPPKPDDPPTGDPAVALFARVLMQQEKIAAHLNPLGLHDAMVPTARPDFLLAAATRQIALTKELAAQAQSFLLLANDADKAIARLDGEVLEAGKLRADALDQAQIAVKQAQTASVAVDLTAELQKIHDEKSFDLNVGTVAEYVLSAFGGPAALGSAFKGVISMKIDLENEETQLLYQSKAAAIQLEIANIQKSIAGRDVTVSTQRETFLIAQRDLLTRPNNPRTLTRDQFYEFAEHFDELARERFNKAHRLAYLYERAAAFRLGTTIDEIGFSYLDSDSLRDHEGTEIFAAPFELAGDLEDITLTFGEIPQPDTFEGFEIDLETRFPLEFQRLQQDGTMDFVISLYDLDKELPGISNQRVGSTRVRVIANFPAAGNPTLQLSHRGVSFVRDHGTILSPSTTRLIPTPAQVDAALANLADGNIAGALINGVRVLQQPTISKFLPPADGPQTQPDLIEFALAPLEDYGIAGAWSIEVRGVAPRKIQGVTLVFDVEHFAASPEETGRIEGLVTAYEDEIRNSEVIDGELPDRVVPFGMAKSFADELEDLLDQPLPSEVSFRLNAEHFSQAEFDPLKARVKGVLLQAIHLGEEAEEGVGDVNVTFGHEAETPFSRVTLASGLTEDIERDIPLLPDAERFPVLGRWRIRINEGSPIDRISDIRWFFFLETP